MEELLKAWESSGLICYTMILPVRLGFIILWLNRKVRISLTLDFASGTFGSFRESTSAAKSGFLSICVCPLEALREALARDQLTNRSLLSLYLLLLSGGLFSPLLYIFGALTVLPGVFSLASSYIFLALLSLIPLARASFPPNYKIIN